MKAKNVSIRTINSLSMIITIVTSLLLYSCKRNAADTIYSDNAMKIAAQVLDGETFAGSINSENAGDQLALNYNNGSKLIVIDKLSESESIPVNTITSAELIISNYGLVINDVRRNRVLLLINNDPETLDKFEQIKSLFSNTCKSVKIFGVTIINADRS